MLDTCTLAVLAEMNSSPAISRLLRPAATSRSTSNSRAVSPSFSGSGSGPSSPSGILARRASQAMSSLSGPAPSRCASSAARRSRVPPPSRSPALSAASADRSSAIASG
jgi:hypothetical protein